MRSFAENQTRYLNVYTTSFAGLHSTKCFTAFVFVFITSLLGAIATAQTIAPLMRYSNPSKSLIAFVARGNLWTVPIDGGRPKRMTDDPGQVLMPRFSPDGQCIAFTWRRAGGQDVYVMPAKGGEAKRLTFDSPVEVQDNLVLTWTSDSQRIVFLSQRGAWATKIVHAYEVPVQGGLATPMPLDSAGLLTFAPNGHTIAYNRIFPYFDTRKRYVGGQAQKIYTYDLRSKTLKRISNWRGTDTSPMWYRHTIYFLSDRGPNWRTNLWAYDLSTNHARQITHFNNYDVDCPSLGPTAITFQQGGRLYLLSLPAETLREVRVEVPDDGLRTTTHTESATPFLRATDIDGRIDYALSPLGTDILFAARGDIFRFSTGTTATNNLTSTTRANEDHPAWSSDGKSVAYVSDSSGEQEVVIRELEDRVEHQITHFKAGSLYTPLWSPNGRLLCVADANHNLWLLNPASDQSILVARDLFAEIHDASFSPDSGWLAYSTLQANNQRAIHLYNVRERRDTSVSSVMNSDRSPVFSADGTLLFFISKRHELPLLPDRDNESSVATLKSDGLYVTTLRYDIPAPLDGTSNRSVTENGSPASKPDIPLSMRIDLKGLIQRATPVPIMAGNLNALQSRGHELFYQTNPTELIKGNLPGEESALHAFDLLTSNDRVLTRGLQDYSLSSDGLRVLLRKPDGWYVRTTTLKEDNSVRLVLGDLRMSVDPRQEWAEMFEDAWRLDRDMFWRKDMNGTDWQQVHDAYAALLPRVASHDDFMYVLGQMQGELATSHTFIGGGDEGDPRPRQHTAFLGADYVLDASSGRYRFAKIYIGDNTRERFRAPLSVPGLNLSAGDYLLAVDGRELRSPETPDSALFDISTDVTLTLASSIDGPRRLVRVIPLQSEIDLRQFDWIAHNRELVTASSGGRLGYLFLSDFNELGSEDFMRDFYPQVNKQGLVIDLRWNRGGFTSQWVLEILRRQRVGMFLNREGASTTLPGAVAVGPMVTITNHFSASDGDQFPYYFRQYGLGKVVGTRTWGGVRGIKGPWHLMDGTYVLIPKDSLYSPRGEWVIENYGTNPDVEVDSSPDELATRYDLQLKTAITTALQDLRRHPPSRARLPSPFPAYPPLGDVPPAEFH